MRALPALLVLAAAALPARAADPPAPPDLTGTWGALQATVEVQSIPMVGDVATTSQALVLVRIAQDGAALTLTERLCAMKMATDSDQVTSRLSEGFVKATPEATRPGRLAWKGGRWELDVPKAWMVHGARLERPERDALPETASDPRVVDADRDGHPGITVTVGGLLSGDIYVVQRLWNRLRGLVASPDRVDGVVTWGREQRILGASHVLLTNDPPTKVHTSRAKHWFRMDRVPAGTDCEALRALAGGLFQR